MFQERFRQQKSAPEGMIRPDGSAAMRMPLPGTSEGLPTSIPPGTLPPGHPQQRLIRPGGEGLVRMQSMPGGIPGAGMVRMATSAAGEMKPTDQMPLVRPGKYIIINK